MVLSKMVRNPRTKFTCHNFLIIFFSFAKCFDFRYWMECGVEFLNGFSKVKCIQMKCVA